MGTWVNFSKMVMMAHMPCAVRVTGYFGATVLKVLVLLPCSEVEGLLELLLSVEMGLRLWVATTKHVIDVQAQKST